MTRFVEVRRGVATSRRADNTSVLTAYGVTDKGRVRPINEDCWAFDERAEPVRRGRRHGRPQGRRSRRANRRGYRRRGSWRRDTTAVADWPFGFDPSLSFAGNRLRTAIHLAHVQVLEAAVDVQPVRGDGDDDRRRRRGRQPAVGRARRRQPALPARRRPHPAADARRLLDGVDAGRRIRQPIVAALERHPMRNALTNVVGAEPADRRARGGGRR